MNIKRYKIIVSATALCLIMVFAIFGQTQKTQEAQLLSANQTIERELAGGQSHTYRITLKSNEFLQIKAEQKGVDVVVRLFDSNQKQLVEVNSSDSELGFEELLFITEKEGEYEIQIGALKEKAATGIYTLQWSRQNATEKNRTRVIAKKLYDDGYKLRRKPESESEGIIKLEEALKLYQQIKDSRGEGLAKFNLGNVYISLAQYEKARDYFQQALLINRKIKNRAGEGLSLFGLGRVYDELAEYGKASEFYEQSLIISRKVKDRANEGITLSSLGRISNILAQYEKARNYCEQALIISREIKNLYVESLSLKILGDVYYNLGQYGKASEFYTQSLPMNRAIQDRYGEGTALAGLEMFM